MKDLTHFALYSSYRKPLTHGTQPTEPIRKILANGFTKSTQVHSYGPQLNNVEILRKQHPYVAKWDNIKIIIYKHIYTC